jgi:hypothetical protein
MFETSFNVTEIYSEILVGILWLQNCVYLWKLKTII